MRRKILVVTLVAGLAGSLAFATGLTPKRWTAFSQTGITYYDVAIYPTFLTRTLKAPTGLLAMNLTVGTGGSSSTSQFHLYISDSGNHVIRDFNGATGSMTVLAGVPGSAGYANGSTSSAQFNYPMGLSGSNHVYAYQNGCATWYTPPYGGPVCTQPNISFNNAQEIYVTDSQNYVVRRICAGSASAAIEDCAGNVGQVFTACGSHVSGFADGPSASASMASLGGILDKGDENYYIADAGNNRIRMWDGVNVSTFAGDGNYGFQDGYRTAAQFTVPGKIAVDSAGSFYVADIGNNAIRKIDSSGNVTTPAGSGPNNPGLVNGQGSAAAFNRPTSVVANSADGMVYVADSHNNCIRKVDSAGNVTTYAGTGEPGWVDGPVGQAQFSMPTDIVIHNGFMYVSDTNNNVIRLINMSTGQVTTFIS